MTKLFAIAEVQQRLREEVAAAGGAKKWLRKHKITGLDHVLHMIDDGRLAENERILAAMGLKRAIRYEAVTRRALASPAV